MIAIYIVDKTVEICRLLIVSRGKLLVDFHMPIHCRHTDMGRGRKAGSSYIYNIVAVRPDIEVGRFALEVSIVKDDGAAGEIDLIIVSLRYQRAVRRAGVAGDTATGHIECTI